MQIGGISVDGVKVAELSVKQEPIIVHGEIYGDDEIINAIEYKLRVEAIRRNVCTALCGIHLMGFMAGIVFLDVVANWLLLLLGIIYCLAGTIMFGLMAGGESDE